MTGKFIKVDGVDLNVAWVSSMSREAFVSNPQVNRLFYRIKEGDRATALSTIYQSVTGKKGKSGKPSPVKVADRIEEPQTAETIIDKGE
jgi:hypothetical protein